MKVVIIGGVAGGATAAARLRRLDESAEIVVFEKSGYVSYANCGLPYYIGEVITEEKKLTLQTPQSFKSRFNIDIRVKSEVTSIDKAAKSVSVTNHETGEVYSESYDKLILSPGAKAVVPPLAGVDSPNVFTLRTVEDTYRIKNYVDEKSPKTAVVIGGGFIGLEMAENLAFRGIDVTLAERLPQVMPPLDFDMAQEVHAYLRNKGINLKLSCGVTGIGHEGGSHVTLEDGSKASADIVIMAVGVRPDTSLAIAAGIECHERGGIIVDEHMRTSADDIYAVGDAVRIPNIVTGESSLIALAGPANKQGRIAADHIYGLDSRYKGSLGSSVLKLFDLTIASTGINEKTAEAQGIKYDKIYTYSASHAGYYPGGTNMSLKVLFETETGRILGGQIIGFDGVDKRIDVLATAIMANMKACDLEELDLSYAPPFSSAKDPVNMAGFAIENLRAGRYRQYHWHDVANIPSDGSAVMLDVRLPHEYQAGHIPGSVFITLDELRDRLGELDKSKKYYISCRSGQRSYVACRMMSQNGFECYSLSGGFRLYEVVTGNPDLAHWGIGECGLEL